MELRAKNFKHRGTACLWNMSDYIPRKTVETSTWYVWKARLEQKPVCTRAVLTSQKGKRGLELSKFVKHIFSLSSLSLVSSVVLSSLSVSQTVSPNLPLVSSCVLLQHAEKQKQTVME